jgi:hypothetical protein
VDGETKQIVRCVNDELEHMVLICTGKEWSSRSPTDMIPVIVHCAFKIIFILMFTIFAEPSQGICSEKNTKNIEKIQERALR